MNNILIPSVSIDVFADDVAIVPEADGYLGRLRAKHFHRAEIWAYGPANLLAYQFDERNRMKLTSPFLVDSATGETTHRHSVELLTKGMGTRFPDNCLGLLQISADGNFVAYEIGVIGQNGRFFLVQDLAHRGQFFRDGDRAVCPRYAQADTSERRQLLTLVTKRLNVQGLPPVDQYVAPSGPGWLLSSELEPGIGQVHYWSSVRGIGSLQTVEGFAMAGWNQVKPGAGQRRAFLTVGELAEYDDITAYRRHRRGKGWNTKRRRVSGVKAL